MANNKAENGYAMPLVLVTIFILSLLGTTIWHISTTSVKQAVMEENKMQAYYLARSGAEIVSLNLDQLSAAGYNRIGDLPEKADALKADDWFPVEVLPFPVASMQILIYKDQAVKAYREVAIIESTAVVNDVSVTMIMEVWDLDPSDYRRYWRD